MDRVRLPAKLSNVEIRRYSKAAAQVAQCSLIQRLPLQALSDLLDGVSVFTEALIRAASLSNFGERRNARSVDRTASIASRIRRADSAARWIGTHKRQVPAMRIEIGAQRIRSEWARCARLPKASVFANKLNSPARSGKLLASHHRSSGGSRALCQGRANR